MKWRFPLVDYKVEDPQLNNVERHLVYKTVEHFNPSIPIKYVTNMFSFKVSTFFFITALMTSHFGFHVEYSEVHSYNATGPLVL